MIAPEEEKLEEPKKVTVLVAAYNEGPVIGKVVRASLAAVPSAEVLVIDDGSTDDTGAVAGEAGARVIRIPVNGGKGAAIRFGLEQVQGDILILIDGDGQDDPAEIPLLLAALDSGADLAIGSRFMGRFEPGAITPLNQWGNQFLTSVINFLFSAHLTDTQAGFKAVRLDVLRKIHLRANRFDIEVDLLLGVLRSGGKVVDVPVRRGPRPHGESRLSSFFDGAIIFRRIVLRRLGTS